MKFTALLFLFAFILVAPSHAGDDPPPKVHVLKGKPKPKKDKDNNGRGDPHHDHDCEGHGGGGTTGKPYEEFTQGDVKAGVVIIWLNDTLKQKRYAVKLAKGQIARVYHGTSRVDLLAGKYRRVFFNVAEVEIGHKLSPRSYTAVPRR